MNFNLKVFRSLLFTLCVFSCLNNVFAASVQHNPNISEESGTPFDILIDDFAATLADCSNADTVGKNSADALEVYPETTPSPDTTSHTYSLEVKFGKGPISDADRGSSSHFSLQTDPSGHENEAYQYLEWEIEDAAGGTRRETTSSGVMSFDLTSADFEDADGESGGNITITLIGKYADGSPDKAFTNFTFKVKEGCACTNCVAGASSASLSGGGMSHTFNLGSGQNGKQPGFFELKADVMSRDRYEPSSLLMTTNDGFEIIYDKEVDDEVITPVAPPRPPVGPGNVSPPAPTRSPYRTYDDLSGLREGDYTLWAYVHAPSAESNSLYVAIDDSADYHWDLGVGEEYRWVPFCSDVLNGLSGDHRLYINYGEAGMSIQRLILTADSNYLPVEPDADPNDGNSQVLDLVYFHRNSEIFINHPDGSPGVLVVDRPFTFPTHRLEGSASIHILNLDSPPAPGHSAEVTAHYIWMRLKAPDYDSNKLLLTINHQYADFEEPFEPSFLSIEPSDSWQWVMLGTMETEYASWTELYGISIWTIDSGLSFDRVVITGDDEFDPTDADSQPATYAFMTEFEDGDQYGILSYSGRTRSDELASGGVYLEDEETDLVYSPSLDNTVVAEFEVTSTQVSPIIECFVRMRVEDPGANRVVVELNDKTSVVTIAPSSDWQWVVIQDDTFSLNEGKNDFSINYMDSGVQIDRVLMSADSSFTPSPYPADAYEPDGAGLCGVTERHFTSIRGPVTIRSHMRQVLSGDALIDVVESETDAKSYTINFYH